MAITNINTLQKLAYTGTGKDLQTASDIYLKQSLSNLGQRFSIKGDGVSVGEFSVYELFKDLPVPTESNIKEKLYDAYMMGTVVKTDDDTEITLSYVVDGIVNQCIPLSVSDYVITSYDIYKSGTKVTAYNDVPIAYYDSNGIITKTEDIYSVEFCTYSYTYINNGYVKNPIDITIDRYDSYNNIVLDGIHIYTDSDYTYAYLTHILNNGDEYNINHYIAYNKTIEDICNYITSDDGPIRSNKKYWKPTDVINDIPIERIAYCTTTYKDGSIQVPNNITFEEKVTTLDKEHQKDFIYGNIQEWNESIQYMLPEFKIQYNNSLYVNSNELDKLKNRIVSEFFYALYKDYIKGIENINIENSVFTIYMPYEYSFIYTCNSNKPSQIFTSHKDITVESTLEPESDIYKIYKDRRDQLVICSAWADSDSTEDIFSTWKYYITYNSSDLVNDIIIERNFVLPYINSDGYWNINNVDTSIYARGKDGGQPSLIISYSDTLTGKHEILSTIKKDELTTGLSWDYAYFNIKPLNASSVTDESLCHRMQTYMPCNIDTSYYHENLITFLENAIIMSITSVHSEIDSNITRLDDPTELGPNATVTTFWALTKDEDKYNFTYVRQPMSSYYAVDFNYLTDSEAIIKYYMQAGLEPDKYKHSWLVFDDVVNSLKQQTNVKYAHPVIKNKGKEYFADVLGNTENLKIYNNNTNFVPYFVDSLSMSGSYITAVPDENTDKYFHFANNGRYNYVDVAQVVKNTSTTPYTFANEWYPNTGSINMSGISYFLPTLDLKEVFTRNINTLNRYNILSTDESGCMYYGYIGTSYDIANKSIFRVGTSTTDINLGLKTLTEESERSKFVKHKEIAIDFDEISLNGNVSTPKQVWNSYTSRVDGRSFTVYSTIYNATYTGRMPGKIAVASDYAYADFQSIIDTSNSIPYVQVDRRISYSQSIGNNNTVQAKVVPVTYFNLNWMMNNIFHWNISDSISNVDISGDASKIYTYHGLKDINTYFLEMSTDITDESSIVEKYVLGSKSYAYVLKMNPLNISYTCNYDVNGTPVKYNINIREITSTQSTTYSMYDGGELSE